MNKESKINLTNEISDQIKNKNIKMRSKWFFIAEKFGLEGGLAISIILGVLLMILILYIMEQNGIFEFAEFGWSGWKIILANVPYDLLIIGAVFFIISNLIIQQFDFSYRKPFYLFSSIILVVVSLAGLFLFWSGIGHAFFDRYNHPNLASMYNDKINNSPKDSQALIGKVVKTSRKSINIQTPQNKIIQVNIQSPIESPVEKVFAEGQIVKIVGQKSGSEFNAKVIRLLIDTNNRYNKLFRYLQPTATKSN